MGTPGARLTPVSGPHPAVAEVRRAVRSALTDLPPGAVHAGDFIELFGPHMPIDVVSRAGGTIDYVLLTNLGPRYRRDYIEASR